MCGRADQDAQHDRHDMPLVLEDVAEDALGGSRRGFLHRRFCAWLVTRLGLHGFFSVVLSHFRSSFHFSSSGWAWFLVCDS